MFHGEGTKIMKDIFSTNFTSRYREKVFFDIVKDDKNEQESYYDKILGDKIIGLEIDELLKNHGCKAIFNRIEKE
jgi:hypothetical protein